jgi:thioredoxin reductase (NADPH)
VAGKRRHEYDVVVLGGGLAGLTALSYATQCGLAAAVLEGGMFGGLVATVTTIEGYPSITSVSGAELATTLLDAARAGGADVVEEAGQSVQLIGRQFRVSAGEQMLRSRTLVIATGARLKELRAPGGRELLGRGISHCASCDGPLFRDQDVVVVGSGDAALQEAALLAAVCKSVILVVRGRLRARRQYVKRVQSCHNVRILWGAVVEAVLGQGVVEGVRLRDQDSGRVTETPCTAVFPYLGLEPNTGFLAEMIELDEGGHAVTDASFATSRAGIYAVGAVRRGFSGELCSAAGEGAAVMKTIASGF